MTKHIKVHWESDEKHVPSLTVNYSVWLSLLIGECGSPHLKVISGQKRQHLGRMEQVFGDCATETSRPHLRLRHTL